MSLAVAPRPNLELPRRPMPHVPGTARGRASRIALSAFLAFFATMAFGGGMYGLTGAPDVPVEWLAGSPFETYFVPSLILFVVVGGSFMVAAIAVFFATTWARNAVFTCAAVVLTWIAVQLAIIGYTSFLQVIVAAVGALLLLTAIFLPSLRTRRVA